MILQTKSFHQADVYMLQVQFTNKSEPEYRSFSGETKELREEAAQLWLDAVEKNIVVNVLYKWLNQREKAWYKTNADKAEATFKLKNTLNYFCQFKYPKVCAWITENRLKIEAIAPPSINSGHYAYYHDTIISLLDRCEAVSQR